MERDLSENSPHRDETLDHLRKWDLRILQGARGYRFSIDSLILASLVHPPHRGRILDLGTGCGVLGLILARQYPQVMVTGIEIQPQLVERARRNVVLNGLEERMEVLEGSYAHIEDLVAEASYHYVITNPPYRRMGTGRLNPQEEKAVARHEMHGGLDALLRAAHYALVPRGKLGIIFTATRTVDLLHLCRLHGVEPKRIRFIHPYVGEEAQSIFLEGVKGGREGEVRVEPPLFIYSAPGIYTLEVARMLGEEG